MRCFIGFFGMTRSLRHTAGSIRAAFHEPLRHAGIPVRTAGHFNLPDVIENPRSGERGLAPDRAECRLLDLDLCWIEPQREETIAAELELARAFPDAFGDGYRSVANLCQQLHSLRRLWTMLQLLGVGEHDLILLLRPDLFYVDALDPLTDLRPILDRAADLVVPAWQPWGGLNDRFAFCTARGAEIYATRFRSLIDGCLTMGGIHAEMFLRLVARQHGLRVDRTGLRAVRVRADGRIAANDAAMLARRTPPDTTHDLAGHDMKSSHAAA
jgi:hypothetical protein